ncbi:aminoglycoside phosphotransferase family protein [Acrocarpospora sp. B8E8]|uniref:aminoglycoside phosphotransferase family protein n=1 Tax=Acrocarpospora sp. B8E8 TaxID=3153572 RepID=UPI00325DE84B
MTYHAEALGGDSFGLLQGVDGSARGLVLAPDGKRAEWATADGVRAGLAWAEGAIRRAGFVPMGWVEQVETWNLSGLFRIRVEGDVEAVWFKATPGFAACESTAIGLFGSVVPDIVPRLIDADPERRWVLLGHAPGEDCWGAPQDAVGHMVPRMVAAQVRLAGRAASAGLADRTSPALAGLATTLLDGDLAEELTADELRDARGLVRKLPDMVAALEACGLPSTVVHGDFHPGNWRWDGRRGVVVDFADCHFGHPALDGLRLREFAPEARREQVTETWVKAWADALPGADPERAVILAEPLARLYYAIRYQEFMDGIEQTERRYHAGDAASEIRAALASAG